MNDQPGHGMSIPRIIAHRGASDEAPENTLAAVRLAWERQADAVEIDLHLSSDGALVVHHDASTGRTCGQDLTIARSTLADLRRLDAGAWKGPRWVGERIVTLDQVIEALPPDRQLFIEAKVGVEIISPLLEALDRSARSMDAFAVISFSWDVVSQIKALRPELKAYWLHAFKPGERVGEWLPPVEAIVSRALEARVDGVNLAGQEPMLRAAGVAAIRDAGLGWYAWTIDDAALAQRLVGLGVDGITTNRPGYLRARLRG